MLYINIKGKLLGIQGVILKNIESNDKNMMIYSAIPLNMIEIIANPKTM